MTHGFGDAENKLTGQLDPLHPAFPGRFAAYSGTLRRSRGFRGHPAQFHTIGRAEMCT
jgi:hypothetical protein